MRRSAWRKKYKLPPGYVQDSLFQEEERNGSAGRKKPNLIKVSLRFLAVVVIIAFFTAYLTQQIHLMSLSHEIAALEEQLEIIHRDNERFRLAYTQAENLAYVEQIAVHKLGMVRPQQIIYLKNIELASK